MDAFTDDASRYDNVADALTIAELAAMAPLEYDRVRQATADRLGCRTATLDELVRRARAASEPPRPSDPDDVRPPEFTDEALALRFAAEHAERLRYVAVWGRWLIWDGTVWRFDDTMRAFDLARLICRQASAECNDARVAPGIASARTVAAVERLAKADRRHASTVEQWDADPWLLNTPVGVVDLQTAATRPHRPGDYMTKITAVAPGGECPLWHQFLARITGESGEMHDYLQRVMGYCLTGITREHALFFAYGTGANGKGVFLNTLTGIFGAYAMVAPMETFTAAAGDRHPTDLAMLRGARLVSAQETEEGRRWAESRIKSLTGGDPVSARFMRQDHFTFTPLFKLFIAGNHKPALRGVDESIARRMNLIPFAVTVPQAERDHSLAEKLKHEWPGILAWAIEGTKHWQRLGLRPPATVVEATSTYMEEEDALGQWIRERCTVVGDEDNRGGRIRGPLHANASRLFASWKDWADLAGEFVGSQKRFSQALAARGFEQKREPGTGLRGFVGIELPA